MSQINEAIEFVSTLVRCSVNQQLYLRTSDGYTKIHADTLRVAADAKHPSVTIDYSHYGSRYIENYVWDKDNKQIVVLDKQHEGILRLFELYRTIEIQAPETKKSKATLTSDERMAELESDDQTEE